MAKAVAGEASVPYFHAAGSEFDEVLVGQGARRVRDLFKAAKMRAPCVIFIGKIYFLSLRVISKDFRGRESLFLWAFVVDLEPPQKLESL